MTDSINIIGLMSGTSVDGLDMCYVSFPKNKIEEYEILNCTTVDYPTDLKNQLNNIINYDQKKIKEIDIKFGEFIFLLIFFPSTIIKLEIPFINVSSVLTVSDIAKIITATAIISEFSFNNKEKKARSGLILLSREIANIPVIPIIKTVGIIIINENLRLLFKTL